MSGHWILLNDTSVRIDQPELGPDQDHYHIIWCLFSLYAAADDLGNPIDREAPFFIGYYINTGELYDYE
jgi:hypothetical protein